MTNTTHKPRTKKRCYMCFLTDQLERVFLRLGHAETDEQLQDIISKFLPPVLLKLSSVQEGVRKKVRRVLPVSVPKEITMTCTVCDLKPHTMKKCE